MEGEGVHPVHPIKRSPSLPGGPWYHGLPLKIDVPLPMQYQLDEGYPDGIVKMLYGNKAYPVMHQNLAKVLEAAGVNNLELFPAEILNPDTKVVYTDYLAFNIVGILSAMDVEKSVAMDKYLEIGFESVFFKKETQSSLQVFRLAENCSAICVSESIKKAVEEAAIEGIVFYQNGEWSG